MSAATLRLDHPHVDDRFDFDTAEYAVFDTGPMLKFIYAGKSCYQPRQKGFLQIRFALARPWNATHILEADALGCGDAWRAAATATADPLCDPETLAAYRERWSEVLAEMADAERCGDPGRLEIAQIEKQALEEHLAGAVGLRGRSRNFAGDAENARMRVKNTISRALKKFAKDHPPLWRHLDCSLQTGMYLMYAPEQPISWEF